MTKDNKQEVDVTATTTTKGTAPLPSDALFKTIMEDTVAARVFLECYLPQDFRELVDLSKIKIEKESFVEDDLTRALSDIVYSIKTKDNNDDEAYVFVLIEHQSTPDRLIAFRLWKYMLLLCERHLKEQNKKSDNKPGKAGVKNLPLITPIVFYNGTKKYNAPLNLWELFFRPELAKQLMTEDYRLIDLQSMSDEEIKKKDHLGMIEFMMKNIHTRDILKLWDELLSKFKEAILVDKERSYIYIKHLLWYSDTKVPESRQQELNDLILKNLNQKDGEDIMRTIAQKYIEEGIIQGEVRGKAAGIQEGEAKGIEKAALNMLSQNLDPKLIAQYTGLTVQQIEELARVGSSNKKTLH